MKQLSPAAINSQFATDVSTGLQANPKYLKSKYFYDEKGDELFQKIMDLPEYYLTKCELEILEEHKDHILKILNPDQHFHFLDLGAGDAAKSKILLKYFLDRKVDFTYCPVDISSHAITKVTDKLEKELPSLAIKGISKEYLHAMEEFPASSPKVIFFLGSSIGNFSQEDSQQFLQEISLRMNKDDFFIIGFDLKKDPGLILDAYNDRAGVTRLFNLNLLVRINRELEGNLDVESYKHDPYYDEKSGEAISRLVSTRNQLIEISSIDLRVKIKKGESIHTEISRKYDLKQIESLAAASGFVVVENLMDSRRYFTDSVWKKIK